MNGACCNPIRSLALVMMCTVFVGCGESRPFNVVLVTLDTTRADFIACYGHAGAHTPTLDALAAEGFLFEHAYSSNPVTQAAHATILTGVYPLVHGVRDNSFFQLPESQETLAELLSAAGYATAAAIGGFPLTREFGTAQGFDLYDDDLSNDRRDYRGRPVPRTRRTWYDERPAGHVDDAILPWLRKRVSADDAPFFLWLHYWDAHEPHIPPPPYRELFAHDPYSGEIAYVDESLGAVVREISALGELERTLIVVTADHGEGRGEHHEMTHAFLAYDTTLHVPLIMRVPEYSGGVRIGERVGTIDIVPTVLDLVGVEPPGHLQGRSLGQLIRRGTTSDPARCYYAESMSPRLSHGAGELRVLFSGPYKYIHGPRPELFNLENDPRELENLVTRLPETATHLEQELRHFITAHSRAGAADAAYEASVQTRRQLEALGYLTTTGHSAHEVVEELRLDGSPPQDRVRDLNLVTRLRNQLGRGRYRLAAESAETLLATAPDHPFYRAKLAAARLGLGQIGEAATVVDETVSITAANIGDFLAVAEAVFDSGEHQRGLAMARRLVGEEETVRGHLVLARFSRELGDQATCAENLDRAVELEPENLQARLARVEHLTGTEALAQARDEIEGILRSYPAFAAGHLAAARVARRTGLTDEALDRLERAITVSPGLCEAHLERIELLAEADRRAEVATGLETMLRDCRDRDLVQRARDTANRLGAS